MTSAIIASTTQTVAVVVCAYTQDRWSDLVEGLRSLDDQSYPVSRTILVVDHNPELEARAREELAGLYSRLEIVSNEEARGLSGARNTGIKYAAKFDVVAFLDDDALPAPTWLAELMAPFRTADVWVTGGRAEPSWPTDRPKWFPVEFDWVVGCSYRGLPTYMSDVRNVIGCSMAMRSTVFSRAGLFTSEIGRIGALPLGCEETELCIRLRQAVPEARVVYVPGSVVSHRVTTPRTKLGYFKARCIAEGTSKAAIGQLVGRSDSIQSERSYVTRTLTSGFAANVFRGLRGDASGFSRAAMIVAGLALTTYGYVGSSLRSALGRRA